MKWDLSQGCKFVLTSQNQLIYHINRIKDKKHTIISINTEKAFDKIHFFIKMFGKLRIERNFLNLIKSINEKPTVTSHLMMKG